MGMHLAHGPSALEELAAAAAEVPGGGGPDAVAPPRGFHPPGTATTAELAKLAATVGARLADVPHIAGAPWTRQARVVDAAGYVPYPVHVTHPAVAGRRVAAATCSAAATTVFIPAAVERLAPDATDDLGGRVLTLTGTALASVCRVAAARRWAGSEGDDDDGGSGVPDGTGMVPIPGVYVAVEPTPRQPGARGAAANTASVPPCLLQAYFPEGWQAASHVDVPDGDNDASALGDDGVMHHVARSNPAAVLDALRFVSPAVPTPVVATVSVVALPPRPRVAVASADAGATPMPTGTSSTAVALARQVVARAGVEPTLAARCQLLAGHPSLSLHAVPSITAALPPTLRIDARDARARPAVTLRGAALFGAALLDAVAAPDAEALIDAVRAAVAAREEEEAAVVAADAAGGRPLLSADASRAAAGSTRGSATGWGSLPPPPSLSPHAGDRPGGSSGLAIMSPPAHGVASAVPGDLLRLGSHLGSGGSGGGDDGMMGISASVGDLTMPTLHLARTSGAPDMPHAVRVRFQVARRAADGTETVISMSAPTAGWYTVTYDEALVNVGEAVNRMTGTDAAAGNARAALSTVVAPRAGPAGGRTPSMFARSTAPGGGGGDDDDDDAKSGDDGDEEGCVGTYGATITCVLPDLVLASPDDDDSHERAPVSAGSAASSGHPSSPRAASALASEVAAALCARQVTVSEFMALWSGTATTGSDGGGMPAGMAAKITSLRDVAPPSIAATLRAEHSHGGSGHGGGEPSPAAADAGAGALIVRPQISVNGGVDFVAADPSVYITLFNPAVTRVVPPVGPAAARTTITIQGSGFVPSAKLAVRLTPLAPPPPPSSGASSATAAPTHAAGAPIIVPARFLSSTALVATLPPLSVGADASGGGAGYASWSVEVTIDGDSYTGSEAARFVAYAGGVRGAMPVLVPVAGGRVRLTLDPVSIPSYDALAGLAVSGAAGALQASASAASLTGSAGGTRRSSAVLTIDATAAPAAPGVPAAALMSPTGRPVSTKSRRTSAVGGAPATPVEGAGAAGAAGAGTPGAGAAPVGGDCWLPPVTRVGHPAYGLGSQLLSATLTSDRAGGMRFDDLQVIAELEEDGVSVVLPPLSLVTSRASSASSTSSSRGGDASSGSARTVNLQLVIAGVPVGAPQRLHYFGTWPPVPPPPRAVTIAHTHHQHPPPHHHVRRPSLLDHHVSWSQEGGLWRRAHGRGGRP